MWHSREVGVWHSRKSGAWHSREGGAWHSKEGGIASQCVDVKCLVLVGCAYSTCLNPV